MSATMTMHVEDLRDLQRLLASLGDHVCIGVQSDGWHIVQYDPSHVAMIDVHIARGAFVSYDLADGPMSIGLDLVRLGQILKQAPKAGHMDISIGERTITWSDGHTMRWRQRMAVLPSVAPIKISHQHVAHCYAMLIDLRRSARMAAIVDDTIRLRLDDESLTLGATAGIESIQMTIPTPDAPGAATVSLPLEYWAAAVASIPQTDVRMDIGTDMPVSLAIDAWDHNLTGRYLIAPRIEGS